MFITPADLDIQSQQEVRKLLGVSLDTPEGLNKLSKAERIGIDQMKSYLNYDVDAIFPEVLLFDALITYEKGNYCYFKEDTADLSEYKVYTSIQDIHSKSPSDPDYWEQKDPRNHLVIMFLIDIMFFHLYSARSARTVPEQRSDRYDEALDWLRLVAKGKVKGLPKIKKQASQDPIFRYGSRKKEDHTW